MYSGGISLKFNTVEALYVEVIAPFLQLRELIMTV